MIAVRSLLWGAAVAVLASCGGGGASDLASSTTSTSSGSTTNNSLAIVVSAGPTGVNAVNTLYTTVTVCAHGSTTECQTIDNVQVDTASAGFRVLAGVLGQGLTSAQLTQVMGSNGNALVECTQFADGYSWGPIKRADLTIAGETASNVPIQVIGDSQYPASTLAPVSCTSNVPNEEDTVLEFGANAIIGVQGFQQDCGQGCDADGSVYNDCTTSSCVGDSVALASQVENPVFLFATDNNGVQVQLPSATGNEVTLSGVLLFGIGTQSNNALASTATIYTLDPNEGTFTTMFAGQTLPDSIADTGSAAYYFPAGASGLPVCQDDTTVYCPASTQSFMGSIQGANGNITNNVAFSIGNGDALIAQAEGGDAVLPTLGSNAGNLTSSFDWGLAFFYGRNVYVGNEGYTIGGQTGPLIAF